MNPNGSPHDAPGELRARLLSLQEHLRAHEAFWRASPFHAHTPAWCEAHPDLARALLALTEDEVVGLSDSPKWALRWLTPWLPDLAPLERLCALPVHPTPPPGPERTFAHVPGDKRAQVEAFVAAARRADSGGAPWLEWCAGKGHLGRWLALSTGREVLSLEWDPALCAAGRALAARTGARQTFRCQDVRAPDVAQTVAGRHIVALHACGDLHRRLVESLGEIRARALHLAPCCYDRTAHEVDRGLNPEADLALDRLARRLAVTDTGGGRSRNRRRQEELGWKLAYKRIRERETGVPASMPLDTTPRGWSRMPLPAWCRAMAGRDGFEFSPSTDWDALAEEGRRLGHRFTRLNVPRLAMRRALEVWLVTDMALYLARRGHRVGLSVFCPDGLTPRNLFLSAREA